MWNLSKRWTRIFSIFMVLAVAGVSLAACGDEQGSDENRKSAVQARQETFDRAEALFPAPTDLTNFPLRQALVEFVYRQDLVNHPWYIYLLGMNGEPIGYFVGKTYPINSCNFLSSSTQFVDLPDGVWGTTSAPSYDGMFYGGGGAQSSCNSMFFFDATTNAMVTFSITNWIATDQPLTIETDRIGTGNMEQATPEVTPTPQETPTQGS